MSSLAKPMIWPYLRTASPFLTARVIKADRPGVAVAVAGAGLERDAARRAVLRRRRADQHVADIPGGDRLHQPQRLRRRGAEMHVERRRRALARKAGIEHDQIGQFYADAAETDGQAGRFARRQHQ